MEERIISSLLPGKDIICFSCQGLLADPRVCDSCGEIFCLKCLENLSKCANKECFSEKTSYSLPMKKWLDLLFQTKIQCSNKDFGCSSVLDFQNLKNHEENECLGRILTCSNEFCKEKMRFSQLEIHLKELCEFKIIPCQNQGCIENFILIKKDEHLLNCNFLPKCEHQCETCRIENMKFNKKINELSQLLETKKLERKNIDEISQAYETKILSLENTLHEKNNLWLQTQGIIQQQEEECKILKENLLKLEQKLLAKDGECKSLKNAVLEFEQKKKTKSEPTSSPPIQDNPKQFDPGFGKNYYTFSDNFTKATWKQSSAVAGYADFQHYPVVRISSIFKAGFCVKFIMTGYGWFGLGSPDVSCEGFPGYTPQGWVIRNSNGGMYHNNTTILNSSLSCDGKLTMATYDPVHGNLNVECENQKAIYKYNFPKEVYFVFSVRAGTSIEIVS